MTTFYFAARYNRNAELRRYRDELEARWPGQVTVNSRWIDQHGGDLLESLLPARLNSDPAGCWEAYGRADIEDLHSADVVVSFTDEEGGGKGGRHVEYGGALTTQIHFGAPRMVIVGPRENLFHTAPGVEVYADWPAFLAAEEARYLLSGETRAVSAGHPFLDVD